MREILPVLIGGDMNCYSVARAFHEEYGVVSRAFGRYAMGEVKYSRIVRFTAVPELDNDAVFVQTLQDFAAANPAPVKILLGCTDDYAALLIRHRDALAGQYVVPYIDGDLAERLVSKESFYKMCDAYNIPYPATVVLAPGEGTAALETLPFAYPVIVKPSSSIAYWKHPFAGMKKVYTAATPAEAAGIVEQIFASGYGEGIVVQDTVPGFDDKMRVLTAYSDRHGRVQMMCLGHVLLEEHTPRAIGNHAAILTTHDAALQGKIRDFLEAVGYVGFSNFDIKYDERDGRYKVFEINLRQGRSNYYVTGSGLNLARFVVQDRVLEADSAEPLAYCGESFWHSIPKKIVFDYTADAELVRRARALAAARRDVTSLDYDFDKRGNPLRRLYIWEHGRRYHKRYKTYCPRPGARGG